MLVMLDPVERVHEAIVLVLRDDILLFLVLHDRAEPGELLVERRQILSVVARERRRGGFDDGSRSNAVIDGSRHHYGTVMRPPMMAVIPVVARVRRIAVAIGDR